MFYDIDSAFVKFTISKGKYEIKHHHIWKINVYHDTEIYDLSLSVPSVFMLKS